MSKSKIILIPVIAFCSILVLFSLPGFFGKNNDSGSNIIAQTQPVDNRLAVRVHIISTSEFTNRIFSTGTVRADEEVMLRPEVSGRITDIFFTEGSKVRKGELLVKINDAELQAQLRRAQYRENLAKIREERTKNLIARNAIAQEEYDIALNELNVVRSEIELIRAQIELTEIRAPFDGVVGLKYVSSGALVTPNTDIASFQNIDRIKIDFSIPERHASSVRNGQRFTFNRQGSDVVYNGTVFAVQPRIDTQTRTLSIRGLAANPDNVILPGAFVEINYNLDTVSNAIMIPTEAIIPVMGGQNVLLYRNGRAESVPVQIGSRTDTRVLITDGVVPGDTLITTGVLQLRSGVPVRISEIR